MSISAYLLTVYGILVLWMVIGVWRLTRRGRGRVRPGPALLDSMDLLFDDRQRAAVEVIVEERTGYRDPEDRDGDLPQLEVPSRR
jgi:hypothetical protein